MQAVAAQLQNWGKYELQLKLERLYDKHQLIPRIREEFRDCEEFDFPAYLDEQGIPREFGLDLLTHMAVRKRANLSTLVGILRHHFDSSQATASGLEQAVRAGLVSWFDLDQVFIVEFTLSAELQAELDRYQYPLPMVVEPTMLYCNLDTGYIMQRGSVILRDNHHNDDVCLDHLNRSNRVKFALNLDTAQAIQNKWRHLDKKKLTESWQEFQRRRKAFEKYDRVAKDVISLLIQEGNELYLTHRYDKRGRTYCSGFHINYQGTDWNKAILELADQELVEE